MADRGPGLRVRFARTPETADGVLGRPLYLPAVLNEFTVHEPATFNDYQTVSAGEFSVPAFGASKTARNLREIPQLEALTLDWEAPWLMSDVSPGEARAELYALLRSKSEFEMLAMLQLGAGRPEEERFNVTLRDISRTLKHGEADTRYYVLQLKESRQGSVARRSSSNPGRGKVNLPTTATLDANDTLVSLSQHYYGSGIAWREIANANGIRGWGQSAPLVKSHRFKVGSKVKIPQPPIATIGPVVR